MAVVPLAYLADREKWDDCPICHAKGRAWQYDRQACSACGFDRLASTEAVEAPKQPVGVVAPAKG